MTSFIHVIHEHVIAPDWVAGFFRTSVAELLITGWSSEGTINTFHLASKDMRGPDDM